jgi:hypothetical protein
MDRPSHREHFGAALRFDIRPLPLEPAACPTMPESGV